MAETITVTTPGISWIQDLGRRWASRIGQLTGGALDQYSAEVANALVASAPTAPLLELVAMDFGAVASTDLLVAVTGAPADIRVAGVTRTQWEPFVWPAGTELTVRGIRDGLRVYLAVHGSISANYLLGSCAPDSVLGFGRQLMAGDDIAVAVDGPAIDHPYFRIPLFRFGARAAEFTGSWWIDVTDGPDIDEFGTSAERLCRTPFVIGANSNHIGLRLTPADPDAAVPRRESRTEILSRGVPIGAVEVPAGDELLVLHRGRGVTAGYPVLAVVTATGLSRLGQARPGQRVRFRRVTVPDAVRRYRAQQAAIDRLRARVATAFDSLRIPVHTSAISFPPPSRGLSSPLSNLEYA
ncbi:biotin-dependent carboxyltransferase family protein [Nocardia sp. NBC_00565]|uniref:5-oxoprolinase subunit C family protein n=1 Tax=Nocardia sp. NBC_00565 TaxID=2975993 RepID=UPI002E823A78|nr:biotin-dependent carboxyltransferase family protein [Nocardia sp. NBC_00565]WUC05493.1 biotin-dependent carboxyltransferase family protein [Nocardia sp. NBC_00565]